MIHVERVTGPGAADAEVELVERKGLGHPDSICDAVMDRVSQALCEAYRREFGTILHHNCDKGLLVAGRAECRLGGGRVLEPMRLVIGDRATFGHGNRRLDVGGIAVNAARRWFREHLPRVDPERHVIFQPELRPGSEALTAIFRRGGPLLPANDTSAAVGYAPATDTERLVLAAERYLNSPDFKRRFPETGEDVKVMGIRRGARLDLVVAMPLVDAHIGSEAEYFGRREAARQDLAAHLDGRRGPLRSVAVALNTLDRPDTGISGMYLSVLGTSAESGDSGAVGRGNGVDGVIAPGRPRGAEAAAGKNPVSHVGKIYSVLSHALARRIHREIDGVTEAVVRMCSRIGQPVDRPEVVAVQVRGVQDRTGPGPTERIVGIVEAGLAGLPGLCEELARGEHPVC